MKDRRIYGPAKKGIIFECDALCVKPSQTKFKQPLNYEGYTFSFILRNGFENPTDLESL